jgi:hypothetical protein
MVGDGSPTAELSRTAGDSGPAAQLALRWQRLGRGEWQREEPGLAATTHRGVNLSSISTVLELDLSQCCRKWQCSCNAPGF